MVNPCVDEHVLIGFLTGGLAPSTRAEIEKHLGSCSACAELATWAAADIAHPNRTPGREGHPFLGELAPGSRVGYYQILGPVGRGGMGEVYAAYHPDLDRRIALKVVTERGASSSERQKRLLREARAIARLSHPNVVTVHDAGTVGDRVFIAMEFVDGQTLDDWLRSAPHSWQEALDVFIAAGRGLAAAHAAGVIHRDFKPQNVMIAKDGSVRVMDFGLARLATETELAAAATDPDAPAPPDTVTKTGALIGTPAYMAPEQFRGETPDARADQFSFCVALHEALHGARPALPHLNTATVETKGARVPAWLRAVVARGLEPNPESRYPSMDVLLSALARGRTRLRRRAATAGATLVVGLLAFSGWRAAHGGRIACVVPQERIDAAWAAPERRTAVRRAFTGSGHVSGETTWQRLSTMLDEYVKQWGATYVQACEATHVRGEQSAEVLDLRMACLGDTLDQVRALTDAVSEVESGRASQILSAVQKLTPLSRCSDIQLLRSAVPLPRDESTLRAVQGLRRQLADISALHELGALDRALAKALALRPAVEGTGFQPLLGELLFLTGLLENEIAPQNAEASLVHAAASALAGHDDETFAKVLTALVFNSGARLGKTAEAEQWAQLSEGAIARLPQGRVRDVLEAWLAHGRAAVAWENGDPAEAVRIDRESVARKQQALGRRHFDVGQGTSNLAFFLTEAGHPSEALPLADESLSIFHGIGLTDGFWVTGASTNRGDALLALGRLSEAAQAFTVALDALSVVPQTELVYALVGLARTRLAQNREADALPLLERALEACEDARPDDIFKADAQFHLARALWLTGGDRSRARALATAAKATYAAHHHSRREAAAQAWLNETLPKGTGPQSRRQ